MSVADISCIVLTAALLLSNLAALTLYRRARAQRDDALDAAGTMLDSTERAIRAMGDELGAVAAERDAARARAALAESREQIAQEGWARAVDKLLAPAPVSYGAAPADWLPSRGRHLVALDRESVLHG